jgi:DNA repair exonuclease SbcCD nuclease subunit
MRILRVGDPHIRPANIDEANRLMGFVKQIVLGGKIDRLEILGDLFHTHAVIRLEVLEFWNTWLQVFRDIVETVVLVGNHDMSGDHNSRSHALIAFKRLQNEKLRIIDSPTAIGPFVYAPYIHGESAFKDAVRAATRPESKVLVCHQTFSGSQYDNGFYAKDGFNPDDLPFDKIISGHIHKEQIFANGKVDYPGTPKWDSISDANERKGLWLYEHTEDGKVLSRDLIPTDKVCQPIVSYTWNEGDDMPTIPEGSRALVEIIGSGDFITKAKTKLKGKASVSSKVTDKVQKRERRNINSLENFILNHYIGTMDRQELLSYAKEIGIV